MKTKLTLTAISLMLVAGQASAGIKDLIPVSEPSVAAVLLGSLGLIALARFAAKKRG